jgi:hypothetical protein
MRRREFIAGLGGAVAWPLAAPGQQSDRMRRIAVLLGLAADDPDGKAQTAAFLRGLVQLGWIDRRNVQIDYRWGSGKADNIRKYAVELVALAPDVILAIGGATRGRYFRPGLISGACFEKDRRKFSVWTAPMTRTRVERDVGTRHTKPRPWRGLGVWTGTTRGWSPSHSAL